MEAVAIPIDRAKSKMLEDTVAQVVWSARRDSWAGVVEVRHLQFISTSFSHVLDRLSHLLTKSFLQALFSILKRATALIKAAPPSKASLPIVHCGTLALRLLVLLASQRTPITASTVRDPTAFPGQDVSNLGLVEECISGIEEVSGSLWLEKTAGDAQTIVLHLYHAMWLLLSVLADDSPPARSSVVRFTLHAMSDTVLKAELSQQRTLNACFLRHVGAVLSCLTAGAVENWPELVLRMLSDLLALRTRSAEPGAGKASAADEARTMTHYVEGDVEGGGEGSIDGGGGGGGGDGAGSECWLGSLDAPHLHAALSAAASYEAQLVRVSAQFESLMLSPAPSGRGILASLFGSARANESLFRTAVVKALKETESPSRRPPVYAGVLAATSGAHRLLDPPALKALRAVTHNFCCGPPEVDLGLDVVLPPPVHARVMDLCHLVACANVLHPSVSLVGLSPVDRDAFAHRLRRGYISFVLSDELLFRDAERSALNVAFVRSPHLQSHQKVVAPHKDGMLRMLRALGMERDEVLVKMVHDHAAALKPVLSKVATASAGAGGKADHKRLLAFLQESFGDVLALVVLATPEAEQLPPPEERLSPLFKERCVAVLEAYFPAFQYTYMPPLPPPMSSADQRSPQSVARYRAMMAAASRARRQYAQMTGALTVLLRQMEAESVAVAPADGGGGDPSPTPAAAGRFSQRVVDSIGEADKLVRGGDLSAMWALAFRLNCLKLLVLPEEATHFSRLIPGLLHFVRGTYQGLVLLTAHSLVVKLMKQPCLAAAKGFALYINVCVPTRAAHDGSLYVEPKQFPLNTLLKEFTKNIRAVCQALEEWDAFDVSPASEDADVDSEGGVKVAGGGGGGKQVSGAALVMYTVEALRHCILYFVYNEQSFPVRMRAEAAAKKRFYINALINLLQCSTANVLTKVCNSLETVLSSLKEVREVSFWLSYTSKRIKNQSQNPSTKQQIVAWFLSLQSLLSPERLGSAPGAMPLQAKL